MKFICFFMLIMSLSLFSTSQKIYGKVYNEKGELLPFSSITIKGTSSGVTANNKAVYNFNTHMGTFVLICQHIGYEATEKRIECSGDMELDFILKEQQLMMKELVINSIGENPAYEIIRQAIKKRNVYNNQVKSFKCDLYSKDVLKLRNLPNKIMGQKVPEEDRKSMQLDSTGKGIIYLSEAMSTVYSEQPDKFKMEVNSSRVSGSNSFGFSFPAFINLYTNNVSVLGSGFSKRGFISPIADGALHYYKFKMMGTFIENGKVINAIKVIPKRKFEPLFSGVINITDDDWRIHSFELIVTKESQLEIIDTLKITQLYVPIGDEIWRVKNQFMYFNFKLFKIDIVGNFVTVYSNYTINPSFDKNTFNKVVIKYDTAVNKKPKTYWDSSRPVPLEVDELQDYKVKDSIFQKELNDSVNRNNIDTLKKKQGKIKPVGFLWGGVNRIHYNKKGNYNWGVDALLSNTQFNSAEGLVCQLSGYYNKYYPSIKSRLTIIPKLRYGFSNTHLNPALEMRFQTKEYSKTNTLRRNSWVMMGGKRVSQYNDEQPVEPFVNSILTLFNGKNSMKTYENSFGVIGINKKFESGLDIVVKATYENRSPILNTTKYTFYKKDSVNLTENYPVEKVNINQIYPHQALITIVQVSFKPGQKFIQFPNSKIPLGSEYPTFSIKYTKGIYGILGSDVDFDKWNVDVFDDKNLKLAGLFKYKISFGGFMNSRKVFIQDYRHFKSNDVRATLSYLNGFQLMNSYINSNTASFIMETHVEHHFNGLITNKIPVIKKLKWNLLTGANAYFISGKDNYVECFIGIENIFKLFRLDYVSAYKNGSFTRSSFVLGASGLLGAAVNNGSSSGSGKNGVTINF